MNYELLKSNLGYSILITSFLTGFFNFISVPFLSEFFIKYLNLFTASVILFLISIFIGVSNKVDFKLDSSNIIYVSKAALFILAIELIISMNFHYLESIQDRVFAYSICLTPSFGFILSRPILRLDYIESKLEKIDTVVKK